MFKKTLYYICCLHYYATKPLIIFILKCKSTMLNYPRHATEQKARQSSFIKETIALQFTELFSTNLSFYRHCTKYSLFISTVHLRCAKRADGD